MTDIPLQNLRTIRVGTEDILLDPKRLQFNEANLGVFMEELSLWYDYYSSKLAVAESEYETLRAEKFLHGKQEAGLSDKAAESFATADPNVKAAREAAKQLKDYLRAMDKAADLAMNRGHMLRKEMDKLGLHPMGKGEIDVSDILG
jgi:hypothetical protein